MPLSSYQAPQIISPPRQTWYPCSRSPHIANKDDQLCSLTRVHLRTSVALNANRNHQHEDVQPSLLRSRSSTQLHNFPTTGSLPSLPVAPVQMQSSSTGVPCDADHGQVRTRLLSPDPCGGRNRAPMRTSRTPSWCFGTRPLSPVETSASSELATVQAQSLSEPETISGAQ